MGSFSPFVSCSIYSLCFIVSHVGAYSKNWILAESVQENTRKQEQASSKFGGGGGGLVTAISYSYYFLMGYIYPYDVLQRHYVEFVHEIDILIRKPSRSHLYKTCKKKQNSHKSLQFFANIPSRIRNFFPNWQRMFIFPKQPLLNNTNNFPRIKILGKRHSEIIS